MKENLLQNNLKDLLAKYSKSDVVANIEQSYAQDNIIFLNIDKIKDSRYLKHAKYSTSSMKDFENSVKTNGVYHPILVRKVKDYYEVVIGRKRLLAAKNVDLKEVPVIIRNFDDEETLLILLADLREQRNSNVIQFSKVINHLIKDFHYTNKQLSQLLNFSPSQISNISKLSVLPREVQKMIIEDTLSFGHAKVMCNLSETDRNFVLNEILNKNLSVRSTEELIKKLKTNSSEENKVRISKNKIIIKFDSEDEKNLILKKLKRVLK